MCVSMTHVEGSALQDLGAAYQLRLSGILRPVAALGINLTHA